MSSEEAALLQTLALRERYRDAYWAERDPIAEDRLLWRAHAFRHTVHCLPGQRILELGSGGGLFTRALAQVTGGENPVTAVSFQGDAAGPASLPACVERVAAQDGFAALAGRRFDYVVGMDLLDGRNSAWLLGAVYDLLEPGGQAIFYESNPWNVVHWVRSGLARLAGRPDPRALLSRPRLYELCSEIGFIRIFAVFNDFVFAPLTRSLVWLLRNLSILLENLPFVRTLAGSILLHAQKPPRRKEPGSETVSLFRHEGLRRSVSVVIPCHNEEMNVGPMVGRLLGLYGEYVHEVLLVDDNSTDGTRAVIEELARADARVRGVFRTPPNGVGLALADGLAAARGRFVLTADCDFQHLLPEFRDLFDAAAQGWDVVVGSRFSRHSVLLNYPFAKIFANRAFHALARVLFQRRFRDLTNNLKLMRAEVVSDLVLREPGFAVNAEIGLQPLAQGYRVREVPISWINRTPDMGVSSFKLARVGRGYLRVLARLLRARFLSSGPYGELARRGPMLSTVRSEPLGREPSPRPRLRRAAGWMLAGALLLAAAARLPLLTRQGLWVDEVFSLAMATGHSLEHPAASAVPELGDFVEGERSRPAEEWRGYLEHGDEPAGPGRVLRAVLLSDTSPPLYYLGLWAWTRALGTSDLALRGFSLACALACLPFLARLARWSGGRRAVLPALLLFALAPLSVYYGTEGRMYALLWLCVLACAAFTVSLQRRGTSLATSLAWVAAGACGFLTHYFFAFVWAALVLYLLVAPGRAGRARILACAGATLVLILPWYRHLGPSLAGWRITQDWLLMVPGGFSRALAARDQFCAYFSGGEATLWGDRLLASRAALALFALLGLVLLWRLRARAFGARRLLLWLWLAAAWAGPLVFDLLRGTHTVAYHRYAAAGLPAALLLAASAAPLIGPRLRTGVLALVCLAWLPNLSLMAHRTSRSWCPAREVADTLEATTGPHDLILVHSIPSGVLGVARYYDGESELATWVEQLGQRSVPGPLSSMMLGRNQVALTRIHEVGAPCPVEDWLRTHALLMGERWKESAHILYFGVREVARF